MILRINHFVILFLLIGFKTVKAQKSQVLERLDLNNPQLLETKEAYQKGNEKAALESLLTYYRKKDDMYLKAFKSDIDFIKTQYREAVDRTVKTANEVLKKSFMFRYEWDMEKTNIPYQFKGEINWTASPNGDPEWCYMINRHRFWIDLGKTYFLTGKEKYAKGLVNQIAHWIDNNPIEDRLKKLSWRRIEAGIRCENWIKSFEYIKESKYVTPEFLVKFLNAMYEHGMYINSSYNYFSKTSNWGVLEFHGLFNLSHYFTEFKLAPQWQHDAIDHLANNIQLQILEDGSQWEQSPMYHNELFHCFMNVNLIAQRKNIVLPEILVQKTKAMAYANIKWQKPNFHQPMLGDSDDTDLRGLLTQASFIFNDEVIKSRALKTLDYETFFTLGRENYRTYQNMTSSQPDFLSAYQKSSGDYYMRSSWKEDATYTSLHLKKLGNGHGHDNILHFTLFANQRDYLVDGGRYTYVNNEWRRLFKSSKSHNTLGVDDLPNSIYKNSWTNEYEARSQGIYTKSTSDFDYAEAENTAYKRLKDPVSMKRRMLFLKPNIWLVFDSFSANGSHKYSQYFNFPNNLIEIKNNGLSTTYPKDNLRIQPINETRIELVDAWWSPEYNLKKKSKRAELSKRAKGFSSFISLLYFPETTVLRFEKTPVYNREDELISDTDAEAVSIFYEDKQYTLFIVHNSPSPKTHFFKVNNQLIYGEVVLIEKGINGNKILVIKE
ncbi:alginate lyase family protein [Flavivirga spongiicola]|uniref:Heparinase II/III family protein n=1 Tax=Flavivirga spongiicola TaxID=421621 RepID=A0ABU7XX19_9FLAO|nr:alginate lyase family protein [Flavivirga sp. MEBiC05379]MDO5980028.1 alginate lyase family protein [Flavivirga sp. MEBiC05379]